MNILPHDTLLNIERFEVICFDRDGSIEILSSHEYAKYVPKPGDDFDFSEFDEYPKQATLIDETFQSLRSAMSSSGDVVILTARSNTQPVEAFLKDQGVSGIDIVGVGSSDPKDKARYVLDRVKEDTYDLVHVYEDNGKNIRAIKKVVDDQGIRFQSTMVKGSGVHESKKVLKNIIRKRYLKRGTR